MFSTRKHHQLAHIFHGAIITLMKRGVAYQNTAQTPGTTPVEQSWHQWIEMQSSNRTAFFGFVMDAQHSFMFGHTCILSVHDVRLPLPCADVLWDCTKAEDWDRMMRKTPESPGFLPVLKRLLARTPIPPHCSPYARFILLHGLFSVTAHLKARENGHARCRTHVDGEFTASRCNRYMERDPRTRNGYMVIFTCLAELIPCAGSVTTTSSYGLRGYIHRHQRHTHPRRRTISPRESTIQQRPHKSNRPSPLMERKRGIQKSSLPLFTTHTGDNIHRPTLPRHER